MPLDLKKLIVQLGKIENNDFYNKLENNLNLTHKLFTESVENKKRLLEKLLETRDSKKSNFYFAIPEFINAPDFEVDRLFNSSSDFNLPHIVVGTDGSQINPSSHELTSASLINIGLVAIPYFDKSIPVFLGTNPTVYNSPNEISAFSPGDYISEEDLISYERTLNEIEELVKLAKKYKAYNLPIVALLDGTLIHWHLENFSSLFIERFIERFSNALTELKNMDIPVASFLSNSRSNDLINMLRIYKCPYEAVDCKRHCKDLDYAKLPCNPGLDYKPVLDRRLVQKSFANKNAIIGTKTNLFKSNNKILEFYPDDFKIYFFYISSTSEIARIEIPAYVAFNKNMLDMIHNVIALQCRVGFGYPVVLSEAHNLAVVRRNDREVFYNLIKEQILKSGRSSKISNKEFKKRISFV